MSRTHARTSKLTHIKTRMHGAFSGCISNAMAITESRSNLLELLRWCDGRHSHASDMKRTVVCAEHCVKTLKRPHKCPAERARKILKDIS